MQKAWAFIFLLFFFLGNVFGQDPATIAPTYTHLDHKDLPTVSSTELNSDDLTIAIASGQNFVYILTFGSGVEKRDADGNLVKSNFITGLDSPFDIAVDEDGFIYIADFQAGGEFFDNGQVKIYDSNGNYIRSILTSYFRPMGIDVDENYVYIAEYNDAKQGPEQSAPSSRIRIVDKATGNAVKENKNVTLPYRIATDSKGKVYVSQEGGGNPGVYIFDANLSFQGRLPNIQSPGSVVIDDFDFIHVIEYAGKIDFGKFITSTSDFTYLLGVSHTIRDAVIEDQAFGVKIFNSSYQLKNFFKTEIHFPLDIAFNHCDRMYIDDSEIDGIHNDNFFGHYFVPSKLEFDLEIYQRTPSADITPPVADCVGDFEINLASGETKNITAEDIDNNSYDLCGDVSLTIDKTQFTETDIGENTVTLTVTDDNGNESTCSVKIIVNAEETDIPPQFQDCPSAIAKNNDASRCGAFVNFDTPTATDENGDVAVTRKDNGPLSGEFFPVGETTVTFEADDGTHEPVTCSFTVTIADNEDPEITCRGNISETVDKGKDSKIINYFLPVFSDNCPVSIQQTAGYASGSEFPVGITTNTFEVTDASGNKASCSFTVEIKKDETPPEAKCKDVPQVYLDENGTAAVTAAQFYDGDPEADNVELGLDKMDFDCEDIGDQELTLTITGENDASTTCKVIATVLDNIPPTVDCPSEYIVPYTDTKEFTLPDFSTIFESLDNCTVDLKFRQNPSPGTVIQNDTSVTFFAIDEAEGEGGCNFWVRFEKDVDLEITECAPDVSVEVGDQCEFKLPDYREFVTVNDPDATLSQNIPSGTNIYAGTTEITITARLDDQEETCKFTITALDTIDPTVSCPEDQEVTPNSEGKFSLPNYLLQAEYDDNCFIARTEQFPDVGTEIEGNTQIELRVTDGSNNQSSCYFWVNFEDDPIQVDCPGDFEISPTNNCEYIVPDFKEIVDFSPSEATFDQSIAPGTVLNYDQAQDITIVVSNTGKEETCTIPLILIDKEPVLACPSDQIITAAEGETVSLPDYIDLLEVYNCGNVEIVQDPVAGTQITGDTEVTFIVTNSAGREVSCSFNVSLVDENTLELACIEEYDILADENCRYEVPDFSGILNYVPANAIITQSVEAGSAITSDTQITVTATLDEQSVSCDFMLHIKDEIAPVISCPGDQTALVEVDQPYELPDYRKQLNATDNCSEVDIIQIPSPGDLVYLDVQVTFVATDQSGNSSSCHFDLDLISENQPPVAQEDEYETPVNTPLAIAAENGVLSNDEDPDGDSLIASLVSTTSSGSLEFNEDGSFTYTPQDVFVGQDSFTYKASDGNNETGNIRVIINVTDDSSGEFACAQQVLLGLDPAGEATLDIEYLYHGDAEGLELSADKLFFTCDDLGENMVTLTYSGRLNGSCEVPVSVVDDSKPVLKLKNISIDLNLEGIATITFADVDDGSFDGCDDEVVYTLSKSVFTCKELGENTIQVTAEDANGNITVATTTVKVFAEAGICSEPLPGSEYIFIYPNPNTGSFRIATPADVTIERIEVFDHRGRFIAAKDYTSGNNDYLMELGPLQEAIYVLKIVTSEGNIMKRMIFKR